MRRLVAAIAMLLAGCGHAYRADSTGYVEHRTSPFMLWSAPAPPAAKMAEDRKISEQDCSQPVAQPTANLRCR
jgi:hypothetical protein